MKSRIHLLLVLLLFVFSACSDGGGESSDAGGDPCDPGVALSCDCEGGSLGFKECPEDGSGFSDCTCLDISFCASCGSGADCGGDFGCFEGKCVNSLIAMGCPGDACQEDADCAGKGALACEDGVCQPHPASLATGSACVPGKVEFCPCPGDTPDSLSGTQTCLSSGGGYSACECGGGSTGNETSGEETGLEETGEGCDPDCAGKTCGPDGCGGLCGDCDAAEVCSNGNCASACTPMATMKCHPTDNAVWWFDSCGDPEELVQTCVNDLQCVAGQCTSNCIPHDSEDCHDGHVYWFDSCGQPESLSDLCEDTEFCANSTCVKPFYNGNWFVTGKGGGGLGSFAPMTIALTVDGTDVSATASVFGTDLSYAGTLDGKHFTMTGTYYGLSGEKHDEIWDCNFISPTQFDGWVNDNIEGLGSIPFEITGEKK